MNPDEQEQSFLQEGRKFNQLYAPDEMRADELKAIKEKIEKATNDEERAKLYREALLELYAKNGLLTSQSEKELEMVTPEIMHMEGEDLVFEPSMSEDLKVTYRKR